MKIRIMITSFKRILDMVVEKHTKNKIKNKKQKKK